MFCRLLWCPLPQIVASFWIGIFFCSADTAVAELSSKLEFTYRIDEQNRSSGFNGTMVKSLIRAPNGSLFVGTDRQLLHYHGNFWFSMPFDESNKWVKDMLLTTDNRMLILSDGQLGEIETSIPIQTKKLLDSTDDQDFRFAKKLYESEDGSIWIACDRHVFRWLNGELKKFAVPYSKLAQRNYLHAYHFIETNAGDMFLLSFVGETFHVNQNTGVVEKLEPWIGGDEVHSVAAMAGDRFLVGCKGGLFCVEVHDDTTSWSARRIDVNIGEARAIAPLRNGDFLVSEQGGKVFRLSNPFGAPQLELIAHFSESVFRIIQDRFDTSWLLTDSQFYSVTTMPFRRVNLDKQIEIMVPGFDGKRFIASGREVCAFDAEFDQLWSTEFSGEVASLLLLRSHILVSLQNGEIWSIDTNGVKELLVRLDFPANDLTCDASGRIWAINFGAPTVASFDGVASTNRSVSYHTVDALKSIEITAVEAGEDGTLWVSGNAFDSFLYRWDPITKQFQNMGNLPTSKTAVDPADFGVNGLSRGKGGEMLLATTQGVLRVLEGETSWMKLDDYPLYEFHSILYDAETDVYWGNIYNHLLKIERETLKVEPYDSLLGLPSMLDRDRNLFLDEQFIYFNGEQGLYLADRVNHSLPATAPSIFMMGDPFNELGAGTLKLSSDEPLLFGLGAPEFPGELMIQHVILTYPGGRQLFRESSGSFHPFVFSDLDEIGTYLVEIWTTMPGLRPESVHKQYTFSTYNAFKRNILKTALLLFLAASIITLFFLYRIRLQKLQIKALDIEVNARLQDLLLKNQQLKDSNRVRDRLFSVIGHDLRGSVGNIKLLLELIEGYIQRGEVKETQEYFPHLLTESDSTFNLLNNLLNWSKAQLGGINIVNESILLSQVINEIMDLYLSRIRQKKLKIFLDFESGTVVKSDLECLKTVLRNLLGNAVKFCSEGNCIRIEAQVRSSDNSPAQTRISIVDDGPGMDDETIQKLLDQNQFFTTKGSKSESGSGIGVNLCFELLHLMGSELQIESEVGKGSSFSFQLPSGES